LAGWWRCWAGWATTLRWLLLGRCGLLLGWLRHWAENKNGPRVEALLFQKDFKQMNSN
jgi:hypothetical protein